MKEFEPKIIEPKEKLEKNILPFLSFPIISSCTFKCIYCGEGGELTASKEPIATFDFIKEKVSEGYFYGVRKFRLTGGEPTLHKDFEKIVDFILQFEDAFILVNTNGSRLLEKKSWIETLGNRVKFAVSFDSLKEEKFNLISNSNGYYQKVLNGIELLKKSGNLYRINTVVHRDNKDEIPEIIKFCVEKQINIKLLELCSVPIPFTGEDSWNELHVSLDEIEDSIFNKSSRVKSHKYSRSFGIPMPVYEIDGITITIKSSRYGSRYDKIGMCKNCKYFPCQEGLYDLYILPDGRLCGCRWSQSSVADGATFGDQLKNISTYFQRAELEIRNNHCSMQIHPEFVQHKLRKK